MNYDDVHFGQSDRNCFYHPASSKHIYTIRYPARSGIIREALTLRKWSVFSGYDASSRDFSSLPQLAGLTIRKPVQSRIVYNPSLEVLSIDLGANRYCDVQGNKVYAKVSLPPFESKVLLAADFEVPSPPPATGN